MTHKNIVLFKPRQQIIKKKITNKTNYGGGGECGGGECGG
jgi:hypothetical protein